MRFVLLLLTFLRSMFQSRCAIQLEIATDQFRDLLRQVLDEERPDQNNMWSKMDLYHESIARIFRMCGVS
jgi:hypothetical protein